ncbi:hypothetical protein vB_RpoS-V16_26 [Ruegeria phage vB_RpoS-V16]|uniref:hypothetical protein n=1 Tax=Ruegeria phage vB_RpoS-V16 TaxID=2218618 RepID=UPI000DCAD753|nr:hypothetical protein JT311_gp26 [Ruegeria phage vB_RpoS-V16]AWY09462.1 hypothetical protein vB_RpoS-V16_26 [Ruegeria phage vB_RpoS-V16]
MSTKRGKLSVKIISPKKRKDAGRRVQMDLHVNQATRIEENHNMKVGDRLRDPRKGVLHVIAITDGGPDGPIATLKWWRRSKQRWEYEAAPISCMGARWSGLAAEESE